MACVRCRSVALVALSTRSTSSPSVSIIFPAYSARALPSVPLSARGGAGIIVEYNLGVNESAPLGVLCLRELLRPEWESGGKCQRNFRLWCSAFYENGQ